MPTEPIARPAVILPHLSRRHFLCTGLAAVAWGTAAGAPVLPDRAGRSGWSPLNVAGAPSLRAQAAPQGLLAGATLRVESLRTSDTYRRLATQQCSIATADGAMSWTALRPSATDFQFDAADAFVQFCEAGRIKIRGDDLCPHDALPAWFAHATTAATARGLLREHIRTVAGRYRERMHSWDVVRDAIDAQGGRADGLRSSPWLQRIGDDYIETAFRTAREADPAALLTYTDGGLGGTASHADSQKRTAVLLLLRRLRQRNIPIDAVGIRSHLQAGPAARDSTGLQSFIKECRNMDLEIFLTGMDVDSREVPADPVQRSATYRAYLQPLLPTGAVRAVLLADLDDAAHFSAALT